MNLPLPIFSLASFYISRHQFPPITLLMDVQIITYDSYQSVPTPLDKSVVTINGRTEPSITKFSISRVPIIRIYGKLPTNHSCLLHIHDVFPYLYINFPKANGWNFSALSQENIAELDRWLVEINAALSQSFRKKYKRCRTYKKRTKCEDAKRRDAAEQDLEGQENGDGNDDDYYGDEDGDDDDIDDGYDSSDESSNVLSHSYVSDISIVTGVPFYGYHLQSMTFLKVSLTSPKYITRLARLLGESKIFNKFIQPYESHIPYNLQFLIDYNCYTLKEINITDYLWRTPLVIVNDSYNVAAYQTFFETYFTLFNSQKIDSKLKKFLNEHIYQLNSRINVLDPESFPRIGRTMVELDIVAGWIANRSSLKERQIPQLCVNATQDDKVQFISSTKSLLDDVDNLRKSRGLQIGGSQLGLFDKTPRNVSSSTKWNNHEEIDKLFLNCVKLSETSYYEKFKDLDFTRLKSCKAETSFPSSFRSIDNLHHFPDPNPTYLLSTNVIDFKSDDIFDQLLICSKSFRSNSSSFMENQNHFNQTNHHNTGDTISDLKDEVIESDTENDEEVEMSNESGEIGTNPDHSVSNLTEKLQEASTLEDSVVFDNSDLCFLESTQSGHTKKKPIEPSNFTQRERLATHELFTNYFADSDYSEKIYSFNLQQPKVHSKDEFLNSFQTNYHMLKIEYPDPFYSKLSNFDSKPFIFAGEKFQLKCTEIDTNLYPSGTQLNTFTKGTDDLFIWNYTPKMPSLVDVQSWLDAESVIAPPSFLFHSQTKGPTQKFKGFKYGSLRTPPERMVNSSLTLDQLLLIVEIHVNTTGDKMPDPKLDEIAAVFWKTNIENFTYDRDFPASGSLVKTDNLTAEEFLKVSNETDQSITRYKSEHEMIIGLVSLVEYLDPDILVGFELHSLSWGFILERAKHKFNIDLCQRLSRVVFKHNNKVGDRWGYTHASGIKITGRQLFNLWRRLRSELNLNHYSLENIIFHIFHVRIPNFSWKQLTSWWGSGQGKYLSYVLNYHNSRIEYEMELITKLEIVEKINEQSRLLGIDFYSMIYRGSQFKVECLLVRLAKAENFMLISPSKKQVFKQDSLECIPLVMEPNSALFKSPLVVLDFQSLYPSLIIAYNICYSTMLGKLKNYNPYKYTKMGVANYKTPEGILKLLKSDINLSPNGVMFAKQNVRKSLLAKMLTEILNARIYIKNTMSEFKDDDVLRKLYNNRQLALKLIANVTYGYTSASYSGRMPNSDVADAIVSCGRETLLKAVKEIEKNPKWGAKVVYGDTDSLFVYLPGKTKADAFRIGKEMANHVTSLNPEPIKLKFEKVYLPSILLSKKRYIGWSYEHESQINPKFDAKGIETVRRDGIPAQQKILERAILMLFKTKDISQIKDYILDEFMKILKNKINLQDFLFAKEVRLGTYKNEKYIPPGARLSMKKIQKDYRSEPQYKERVFYLVRKGHNKEILRDRCVSPEDFLSNAAMELDSDYYINKVLIPPLERVFNLFGVDVRAWVREIPKMLSYTGVGVKLLNVKIISCICCNKSETLKTNIGGWSLCENCKKEELKTMLTLKNRLKTEEKKSMNYINFCRSCSANTVGEAVGSDVARSCCNVDCSVYYSRIKVLRNTDTMIREYQKIPDW